MKRICVIDGQGGGIGATIIKALKNNYGETIEILALGTNAVATSLMLKAGANRGATGENPVIRTAAVADLILGPIAITWPNAMMGGHRPHCRSDHLKPCAKDPSPAAPGKDLSGGRKQGTVTASGRCYDRGIREGGFERCVKRMPFS